VVLADSTKWNVVGLSTIATLDEVDVLITDDGLDGAVCRLLTDEVGRLVVTTADEAADEAAAGRGGGQR